MPIVSRSRLGEAACVAALLAALAAQCAWFAWVKSSTYDESEHVVAGYYALVAGDFDIDHQHPPLGRVLSALPLLFVPGVKPAGTWPKAYQTPTLFWGPIFMWKVNSDGVRLTRLTRLPIIGLTLLLAVMLYLWARKLYGRRAGLAALFLCAFSPNLLAHGSLATTDMPAACFSFLAIHALWRWLDRPAALRGAWTGAAIGLALASKISALFLAPAFVLLVAAEILRNPGEISPAWARAGRVIAALAALAAAYLLLPAAIPESLVIGAALGFSLAAWRSEGRAAGVQMLLKLLPWCAGFVVLGFALDHGLEWANTIVPFPAALPTLPPRLCALAAGAAAGAATYGRLNLAGPRARRLFAGLARWSLRSLLVWATAAFVLWGCYGFELRGQRPGDRSPLVRFKRLRGPLAKISAAWLWRCRELRLPFRAYFSGFELVRRLQHDVGQRTWFLGQSAPSAAWYYFPLLLALKLPGGLLALLALSALAAARRGRLPRWDELRAYLPAFVLLAICLQSRMTVGIRHLLPALPFAVLWASRFTATRKRTAAAAAAMLCLWQAASTFSASPHYLAYFNWFAGGVARGADYLRDTNVDWGQDLGLLAAWQRRHPEARPLGLAYFGTADPKAYGVAARRISLDRPWGGPVAASVTLIRENDPRQAWLMKRPILARIGGSIRIYAHRVEHPTFRSRAVSK